MNAICKCGHARSMHWHNEGKKPPFKFVPDTTCHGTNDSNSFPFCRCQEYEEAKTFRFDGDDYQPERDDARLTSQLLRIFNLMRDGRWRTLPEIEAATGDPPASISAQLRHLRKKRFGSHTVNRHYILDGLYEYQLVVNDEAFDHDPSRSAVAQ